MFGHSVILMEDWQYDVDKVRYLDERVGQFGIFWTYGKIGQTEITHLCRSVEYLFSNKNDALMFRLRWS